jgi:hypothetical protein
VTERPDPLVPPEGYGVRPGQGQQAGTGHLACSVQVRNSPVLICREPSALIITFGCTQAEHAGKVGYCRAHAVLLAVLGDRATCGVCEEKLGRPGIPVKIFKREELAPLAPERLL